MKGLSAQLNNYLFKNKDSWISKGEITRMVWKHTSGESFGKTYLPETVGRALRHLEEESRIAVKPDGKSVVYKWLPHERREAYIPTTARQNPHQLFKELSTSHT